MTDQKDYTMLPEVLKVCGLRLHKYTDPDENYWTDGKWHCRGKRPVLTLSELWEGLCRAIPSNKRWARIVGQYAVVLYYGYPEERWFLVVDHGSLTNAVAAALHWVLQQKKEG